MAASSSMFSYLMTKGASESAYKKLVDIKSVPDLGGAPEMLETTTLSDWMQTNIPGIQAGDALEFTCNYDPDDFKAIDAMNDQADHDFAVWLGASDNKGATPDGHLGKFSFSGQISVFLASADVNAVREMTVTIANSTTIEMTTV